MKRISILLVALSMGLAVPTVAPAQFAPTDVPPELTQPDDGQSSKAFEDDSGLSKLQLVMMFGAAAAIVAVIAWFIMRDAHRAAPAGERRRSPEAVAAGGDGGKAGVAKKSAREREREKARKRNKAKSARNQRKRNRPH